MTVFDGGASTGMMTLLFSFLAARVHAFEPHSGSYLRLGATFSLHPRGNVVVNNLALSDKAGERQLNVYGNKAGWSTLIDRPVSEGGVDTLPSGQETVKIMTVDQYCAEQGINNIGLLKLDVEGSEYPAMLGAEKMLSEKAISCIVMEYGRTWWDAGYTPDDVENYLGKHGMVCFNVLRDQPPFPGRESGEASRYAIMVAAPRDGQDRVKSIINFIAEVG